MGEDGGGRGELIGVDIVEQAEEDRAPGLAVGIEGVAPELCGDDQPAAAIGRMADAVGEPRLLEAVDLPADGRHVEADNLGEFGDPVWLLVEAGQQDECRTVQLDARSPRHLFPEARKGRLTSDSPEGLCDLDGDVRRRGGGHAVR